MHRKTVIDFRALGGVHLAMIKVENENVAEVADLLAQVEATKSKAIMWWAMSATRLHLLLRRN